MCLAPARHRYDDITFFDELGIRTNLEHINGSLKSIELLLMFVARSTGIYPSCGKASESFFANVTPRERAKLTERIIYPINGDFTLKHFIVSIYRRRIYGAAVGVGFTLSEVEEVELDKPVVVERFGHRLQLPIDPVVQFVCIQGVKQTADIFLRIFFR